MPNHLGHEQIGDSCSAEAARMCVSQARLDDCVHVLDGRRVPVNSEERKKRIGNIPYYGATGQVGWIDDFLFDEELLLPGEDGVPFLDKSKHIAYIIDGRSWVNNHAHVLRAVQCLTSNKFLKYFLDLFDFSDYVTGSTRLKLTQSAMNSIPVRLAPQPEQTRIVSMIDSASEELKKATERLKRAAAFMTHFRQAVLAAACSGKLTEDWRNSRSRTETGEDLLVRILRDRRDVLSKSRKRHNEPLVPTVELKDGLPTTWALATVDQLTTVVTSGSRGWARYYADSGPFFIRAENINQDYLNDAGIAHVRPPKRAEGNRTRVQIFDLLITITGANVTKSAIVDREMGEAYVSQHVALVRPVERLTADYLYLWIVSPAHGRSKLVEDAYGAGKPGLNLDNIREMNVTLPSLEEQREIIGRVGALFKLADAIEKRVMGAALRADKLTQAILAKAFRGELVPTEAELARREGREYEPASVLLERLKADRAKADGAGTSKHNRAHVYRRR